MNQASYLLVTIRFECFHNVYFAYFNGSLVFYSMFKLVLLFPCTQMANNTIYLPVMQNHFFLSFE